MAQGEQRLAVELLVMVGIMTTRDIANHKQVPHPRTYVGALVLFAVLSGVGKAGPKAQRLADILGAVVVLAYLLAWAKADPTGIKHVTELPAEIASGKGLPTRPTKTTPHDGLQLLGALLAALAAGSLLKGGVVGGGGGKGAGEGEGTGGTEGEGGGGTPTPEPGATGGGLDVPDVPVGP
jgi:hypothetical protein